MGKKRKRPVKGDPARAKSSQQPTEDTARPFNVNGNQASDAAEVSHPVISLYYRQVVTLRQYILLRIPRSSKSRRRRIAAVRGDGDGSGDAAKEGPVAAHKTPGQDLASLLDTTLVGVWKELSSTHSKERRRDFLAFTQAQSTTQPGTDSGPESLQSDVRWVLSLVGVCDRLTLAIL
ncbi:hypothetical protein BDW62DRAFT_16197 [Aspergillus aurantiobrunneus]